jgi:hypothetical protein
MPVSFISTDTFFFFRFVYQPEGNRSSLRKLHRIGDQVGEDLAKLSGVGADRRNRRIIDQRYRQPFFLPHEPQIPHDLLDQF